MEPLFLAVAICFNLACDDQQIFIADKFQPGPSQASDCEQAASVRRAMLAKAGIVSSRVVCKTQSELESEGV